MRLGSAVDRNVLLTCSLLSLVLLKPSMSRVCLPGPWVAPRVRDGMAGAGVGGVRGTGRPRSESDRVATWHGYADWRWPPPRRARPPVQLPELDQRPLTGPSNCRTVLMWRLAERHGSGGGHGHGAHDEGTAQQETAAAHDCPFRWGSPAPRGAASVAHVSDVAGYWEYALRRRRRLSVGHGQA